MKLLIVTQAVDQNDPVLGFFCGWIEGLAKRVERVEVICLTSGAYAFPENVKVHSLGKEKGKASRGVYVYRFLTLAWLLRNDYGSVFVHMNQEYILIAGWLWRLLGKRVFLWRNHYAGSLATDIAATFCTNVFCTSKYSYTATYTKTVIMPVGVDTERFTLDERVIRVPRSILFLARMSPSKRPDMLLDALAKLAKEGVDFRASFIGSPRPEEKAYYEELIEKTRSLNLADRVSFSPSVPNSDAPNLYRSHQVFVNTSPSGMLDKTIFEAAACGCVVLSSSKDFALIAGEEHFIDSSDELATRLTHVLAQPQTSRVPSWVLSHNLETLTNRLAEML